MAASSRYVIGWAALMAAMDFLVVALALPWAAADLGNLDAYSWPSTIFLFVIVLAAPAYGWITRRIGVPRALVLAFAVSALGTLASAYATSVMDLVMTRILQGIGGAGLWVLPLITAFGQRQAMRFWIAGQLLGPCLAAAALALGTWHQVFHLLAGCHAIGLVLALRPWQPETIEPARPLAGGTVFPVSLWRLGSASLDEAEGTMHLSDAVPLVVAAVAGAASLGLLLLLPLAAAVALPQGLVGTWAVLMAAGVGSVAAMGLIGRLRTPGPSHLLARLGMAMLALAAVLLAARSDLRADVVGLSGLALAIGAGSTLARSGLARTAPGPAGRRRAAIVEGAALIAGTLGTGLIGLILGAATGVRMQTVYQAGIGQTADLGGRFHEAARWVEAGISASFIALAVTAVLALLLSAGLRRDRQSDETAAAAPV